MRGWEASEGQKCWTGLLGGERNEKAVESQREACLLTLQTISRSNE